MAGAAGRLDKRLRVVEERHTVREAARATGPAFDPARLTGEELAEAEALTRRVPWRNGRPDFSGLSDQEFERFAALIYKGKGLEWHG